MIRDTRTGIDVLDPEPAQRPTRISPDVEAWLRSLMAEVAREEIEAALAFFEEQTRPEAFGRHVEDAMRRRGSRRAALTWRPA